MTNNQHDMYNYYESFQKKLMRWCHQNAELLVMVTTTSATALGLAMTLKKLGPYMSLCREKLHTALSAEPEKTVELSEAMRQMSAGNVNYVKYKLNRQGSQHSIHYSTTDHHRYKAFLVPGSEMNVFSLAADHVPHFETNPGIPYLQAILSQGILPLISVYMLWRIMDDFTQDSSYQAPFWKIYKQNSFWSYFFSTEETPSRRIHRPEKPITFNDVVTPVKEDLYEIVNLLNHPEEFFQFGASCPRGVLLAGPSGTGKTLLARAVAEEANVRFLSCSASSFVEMYVGRGAKRIRNLFNEARRTAPAVLFIDEIDALGTRGDSDLPEHRQFFLSTAHDEYIQTLNQLLTEMDGFDGRNDGVLVIGATNRFKSIDPALTRAGRFDRWIFLQLPTLTERYEILKVSVRRRGLNLTQLAVQQLASIAQRTSGLNGAELDTIVNEAALATYRRKQQQPHIRSENFFSTQDDLEEALTRFIRSRQGKSTPVFLSQDGH